MIVVDATVLADWLVGQPEWHDRVVALQNLDPLWIAPVLWRFEVGNVLWKQVRLTGARESEISITLGEAAELIEETVNDLAWADVLALALAHGISYYDASYIWLARSRETLVYTRDERLRRKCPSLVRRLPRK